jgi:hypothetical protein
VDQVRWWVKECSERISRERLATTVVRVPERQAVVLCEGTLDQECSGPVADHQITSWPGGSQLVRYKGSEQEKRVRDYDEYGQLSRR